MTRLGFAGLAAAMVLAATTGQAQQGSPRQVTTAGGGVAPEVMRSIARWIAANSELAVPSILPEVRLVPPVDMATLRLGLLGPGSGSAPQLHVAPEFGEVVAFYDAKGPTIYLGSDWTGDTPAELSILVHEMVHHAFAEGREWNRTPGEERLAFHLQDVWLRENGETLEDAFGIDPFTLTMMTQWTY